MGERSRGWDTDIVGVGTEITVYLPKLVSPVSQADESIFLISERILAKCCCAQRNSCARPVFSHIFINHYLN